MASSNNNFKRMDLTRSGGHSRVWRQSLCRGSLHAEEDRVALPGGVSRGLLNATSGVFIGPRKGDCRWEGN